MKKVVLFVLFFTLLSLPNFALADKYIRDNLTGGDCISIGTWNISSKTCTLKTDINETIQINNDNLTLDGNGHSVMASYSVAGIYLYRRMGVTIKNLRIRNSGMGIHVRESNNNIITGNTFDSNSPYGLLLYPYSNNNTVTKNRNKISVHSPVTLEAYDSFENFTGKICSENSDFCQIVENIPNSSYMEFGEGKYLNADEENINKVILRGTDIGIFTYESEIVLPTGESTKIVFTDIPITSQTTAEISINPNTQTQELKLDVDSDGTMDITIQPNNQFDPIVYLQVMRKTIENSDITESRKNGFINRIDATIKEIQKGKIDKAKLKTEKFMHVLGTIIDKKEPKKPKPHRLSGAETEQLLII